jgi:hypothetical protein
MLMFFFAEVHPFGSVTAEPIAVDIVSPEEVVEFPKLPEPPTYEIPPKPEIQIPKITDLPTEAKAATAAKSAAAAAATPPPSPATASQPTARQQKQAAQQASNSAQQQAAAQQQPPQQPPQQQQQQQPPSQPQPQAQPQPPPPPEPQQSASTVPAAIPQEPDVTVKYHVSLGLPPDTPGGSDFDAPASKAADVSSNLVTEFRRHLKTCSKLPASISPADDVRIKMRISMTSDGKLIGEPILIEASASIKGPALMRSAMSALAACQPYAMLPSDRYGEWKSLDLTFTPRDFTGG